MSNLTEDSTWQDGIYQIEITDKLKGGDPTTDPLAIANIQAFQLACRTAYLQKEIKSLQQALNLFSGSVTTLPALDISNLYSAFIKVGSISGQESGILMYNEANKDTIASITLDNMDNLHVTTNQGTNFLHNNKKIWDAGNDGIGSGLDADLLCGNGVEQFFVADNENGSKKITTIVSIEKSGFYSGYNISDAPDTTKHYHVVAVVDDSTTDDIRTFLLFEIDTGKIYTKFIRNGTHSPYNLINSVSPTSYKYGDNGYSTLPDGSLLMYGKGTLNSDNGVVILPMTFPNNIRSVTLTDMSNSCRSFGYEIINNSSIQVFVTNVSGAAVTTNTEFSYMVVGE